MKLERRHMGWWKFTIFDWVIDWQFKRPCSGGLRKSYRGWSYGGRIGCILVLKYLK